MSTENTINYIELPISDLTVAKKFYGDVFGWTFTDWSPEYASFAGAGINGGIDASGERSSSNGTLIIIASSNLGQKHTEIKNAGGIITKEIFSFPGGKRFEFTDPSGNGLAVWSEE